MLAIFAAHAERNSSATVEANGSGNEALSRRLVPGYVKSLLRVRSHPFFQKLFINELLSQNAQEGKLNTHQFRLAYAALVRSASTGRTSLHTQTEPSDNPSAFSISSRLLQTILPSRPTETEFLGDPALAWFCIESLVSLLSVYPTTTVSSSADTDVQATERMRLSLALVSCIPNVSPILLPRLLGEIERSIDDESDARRQRALIDAVFTEITERVGATEKAPVVRWWFECARRWEAEGLGEADEDVPMPQ